MENSGVDYRHQHSTLVKGQTRRIVDDLHDSERLRVRTIQSIQYLASHVPASVLKRLHSETLAQLEVEENQQWSQFCFLDHTQQVGCWTMTGRDAIKAQLKRDRRRSSIDRDSTDVSSVLSEISDLTENEDSDNEEGSPKDIRFPLHLGLKNRSHMSLTALAMHKSESGRCLRRKSWCNGYAVETMREGEEFDNQHDGPRMRMRSRASRRGSLSSQLSIMSQKYIQNDFSVPYASKHDCALLFVDISGFTRLSTLLDPESLSTAINDYFQLIVNEVTQHEGDIIKFAGDALFAEWKVSSSRSAISKSIESNVRMNLEDCATAAAICGAKIVTKYCGHSIKINTTGSNASSKMEGKGLTLSVHCGISVGELVSVHFGDNEIRRENVVLGKAIKDVSEAAMYAELGEVAACPETIRIISRTCKLDSSIYATGATEFAVIADQSSIRFSPRADYMARYAKESISDPLESRIARLLHGWDCAKVVRYRKLLSLYAHPVVVENDNAFFDKPRTLIYMDDRQLEEAELRNIFCCFIAPQIPVSITGNDEFDLQLFQLLNSIMNLVTKELRQYGGQLRQYIVDDKGLVLIATFGLRGSTFPNMVSEMALPCASSIHKKLQADLGVQNRIGATVGNAYCGVVGGLMRHEYAVLGPSVNLAARLMASDENPGILVDNGIRRMADKAFGFRALKAIKAKGYAEPVPIFEPLTSLQRRWSHTKPNFVGRRSEIRDLKEIARAVAAHASAPSRIILISGVSGVGKSTLVAHAIEKIKEAMHVMQKRIHITKYVSRESDVLTPFGSFGSILLDAVLRDKIRREDSYEKCTGSFLLNRGKHSDHSMAGTSYVGLPRATTEQVAGRLSALCCQLNAPHKFAELIGQHLMKLDLTPYLGECNTSNSENHPNDTSIVNFIARAFHQCTQDADLTLIALDDVHLADDMSWRVIQTLFDLAPNIMVVCTTRPLSNYKLTIDPEFWKRLETEYTSNGRYVPLELQALDMSDTRALTAKTLGVDLDEISEKMYRGVFAQSSGIPQFAQVLLENLKRTALQNDVPESAIRSHHVLETTLHQLILQRLDYITGDARNILNLAAVMGASFELADLVEVMRNNCYEGETLQNTTRAARDALALAVQEGILYIEHNGCERVHYADNHEPLCVDNCSCFFSHDIWRSTILDLMLDSRKRTMHRNIANVLESGYAGDRSDYTSRLRIFSHWKGSGDFVKASALALSIGTMFENIGLNKQRIHLYNDALDMWKTLDSSGKPVAGFTREVLDTVTGDEILAFIELYIALGKACTNLHLISEATEAYQNALMLVKETKVGGDIADRSVVFPVFSGLYLLLKIGNIKKDDNCIYEQALVARFVKEAHMHGDPIHYARALAMQCETFSRLGNYERALRAYAKLRDVYIPEEHSAESCIVYGSDRAAQTICASTLWLVEVGRTDEALATCEFVLQELMPKMDRQNVHNSFVMLYPIILILKENNMALKAKEVLRRYILDVFQEFFSDGAFTFSLPMFKPLQILLDLRANQTGVVEDLDSYLRWASEPHNLRFGDMMNHALSWGRVPDSISAEICLLLARRLDDSLRKSQLVKEGLRLMTGAVDLSRKKRSSPSLRFSIPILKELQEMAQDY